MGVKTDDNKLNDLSVTELYAMYKFAKEDALENDDKDLAEIAGAIRGEIMLKISDVFVVVQD